METVPYDTCVSGPRWLSALVIAIAVVFSAAPADAQVFKPRGKTSAKAKTAKTAKATKAKPAKKARRPTKKASRAASTARPSDLTPSAKKKKARAVEDDDDDEVIITDDDE